MSSSLEERVGPWKRLLLISLNAFAAVMGVVVFIVSLWQVNYGLCLSKVERVKEGRGGCIPHSPLPSLLFPFFLLFFSFTDQPTMIGVKIRSYVDSLLAKDLGYNGGGSDTACTINVRFAFCCCFMEFSITKHFLPLFQSLQLSTNCIS